MKRLKYAVILLLGLSMATMMTSCNKESGNQNKIVGKWQLLKKSAYNYDLSGTLINEWVNDYPYGNETWEFFSEGMVRMPAEYWQKSNDDYLVCDYLIEGTTLSLRAWGEQIYEQDVFTIQEMSNSTMVWKNELVAGDIKKVRIYDFKKVN